MKLPVGGVRPSTLPLSTSRQLLPNHLRDYHYHYTTQRQAEALPIMYTNSYETKTASRNPRRTKRKATVISDSSYNNSYYYKVGKQWREYQGSNNWEGLLDPLDDTLRSEILRYGRFAESAYQCFDFDPNSPTYATCKFPRKSLLNRSGMEGSGYKATKNLRATCGVQLPRWMGRAPAPTTTRSSWIGYVAVCQDKDQIARLGRRDVVIAYRGTATCLEWAENLRASLTSFHYNNNNSSGAMVESGFLSLYTSRTDTCPSLQAMVREEIERVMEMYGDEPLSFTVTGHSLGAALATLTAYDINRQVSMKGSDAPSMVTVISFGGPRVGNRSFRSQLEKAGTRVLRIVNSDDVITKVPGFVLDNNHNYDTTAEVEAGLMPMWLRRRVEETKWAYAEVGRELRLCSKESPYLSKRDVATCHDLSTYLHLVNGFVSSKCPFRATAKKMLSGHHKDKLGFA